jgi:hypothetical protein
MAQIPAPLGSRILLVETEQAFTALIQANVDSVTLLTISFLVILDFASFVFGYAFFQLPSNADLAFVVFSLLLVPVWIAGQLLTFSTLFICFGSLRLRIDAEHLSMDYELFNFKCSAVPIRRSSIQKLEYTPERQYTDNEGDIRVTSWPVIIWAAGVSYEPLNGFRGWAATPISGPEEEWLVERLSQWLQIPVTSNEL